MFLYIIIILAMLISRGLSTFSGIGILNESDVEIQLRFKTYTIPYKEITKIRYYSFKTNCGVSIHMGKIKRLDLRASTDTDGLFKFATHLKRQLKPKLPQ